MKHVFRNIQDSDRHDVIKVIDFPASRLDNLFC